MNMMNTPRLLTLFAATALGTALAVSPAAAQQEDARWLPLVGCWEPVGQIDTEGQVAEGELLCIATNAGGVDMHSFEGSELLGTVTMVADGQARDVSREGCTGTETARFAEDRRFITVENTYACDGGVEGVASGLIAMVTPFEWINVQIVESDGEEATGVMRYTLASDAVVEAAGVSLPADDRDLAIRRARMSAARPFDIGDVIAASGVAHPKALEALLVEQNDLAPVNADQIVRMADAGVSEGVIDMVIAVSHPSTFAIQQGVAEQVAYDDRSNRTRRRLAFYPGSFGYLGWSRYGYAGGYGYGYGNGYGYGSYGYGNGYGYGNYGYGYPGYRPIIVIPQTNRGNNGGRAVNGRGYSRGSSGGETGRRARGSATTRSSGGSSSGTAAPRRSGGSGGSAATSRGSSSRGSTARKAKRRGGPGL